MEAAKALQVSEIPFHALRYTREQRVKIHGTSLKQGILGWYESGRVERESSMCYHRVWKASPSFRPLHTNTFLGVSVLAPVEMIQSWS